MVRRVRGALLAGLLLVAGLSLLGTAAAAPPGDPETDVIGWENGYWHNESIQVDQSDGLSRAEQIAYVNRTAARIEVLRGREFNATVPVRVLDRGEHGNETAGNVTDAYRAWNNQVWEALFVVGEDEDVVEVLHSTSTAATTGSYEIETDEIRIVTDQPDRPTIGRGTLAHELVHAQQDQYHNLSRVGADARTQDRQLAVRGLFEGEANYLEQRYQERCGVDWECVASPSTGGGGGGGLNQGVLYTLFHPYSDGPPFVHTLVERDGWAAVDAAYGSPPNSTEQIIHVTAEEPTPLDVRDEARAGWTTFPEQGENGSDVAGEASMFVMLWYQAWEYDADTVQTATLGDAAGRYDTLNYDAPPTAGWGNDAIVPYQRETAAGTEHGYVWATEWDTEVDAAQFRRAYLAILAAQDARKVGPRTWVVDDGPFADAFRVVRDGRSVTVVNAPRVSALEDVRPSIPGISTPPSTTTPWEEPASPMEPEEPPDDDGRLTEAPAQPGFGIAAAAAGLVGWLLWCRRRT